MVGLDGELVAELFKLAPAVIALFGVIYLMYRIILTKDETINQLVTGGQSDIERQSRMVALLEILVNRAEHGGSSKGDGP